MKERITLIDFVSIFEQTQVVSVYNKTDGFGLFFGKICNLIQEYNDCYFYEKMYINHVITYENGIMSIVVESE